MSLDEHVKPTLEGDIDIRLNLQNMYLSDKRSAKVNLLVGVYVEENELKPRIMKVVKEAEEELHKEEESKAYLGVGGDKEFLSLAEDVVFGDQRDERVTSVQTIGGTSAIRTGLEFLENSGYKKVAVSNPTWGGHLDVINALKLERIDFAHTLESLQDFSCLTNTLNSFEPDTIVFFQPENHNPTGMNYTKSQWKQISNICKEKGLFPFFDSAYQGFHTSLEEDAWTVRYFLSRGHEMMVSHSFSKSFGIYSERVGVLFCACETKELAGLVQKNLVTQLCGTFGPPPSHGSNVIKKILANKDLRKEWEKELSVQRKRIKAVRREFGEKMKNVFGDEVALSIVEGSGYFCRLPLEKEEIVRLREEFGVYIGPAGRISFSSFHRGTIGYVFQSLLKLKGLGEDEMERVA